MKNRTLRIGLIVAILTLVTSCFMGSTFAKYVTNDSGSDSARVAKWGVVVDVVVPTTGGLAKSYNETGNVTVQATEKVVAPGTKGTLLTFSITGTPEVSVDLDFKFTDTTDVYLPAGTYEDYTTQVTDTFDATAYYPVVYTIKKDGGAALATGNLDAIVNYINSNLKKQYGVDNIADWTAILGTYTISWAWEYDGKDKEDTLLGNIAAELATVAGSSTKINLNLSITATQID